MNMTTREALDVAIGVLQECAAGRSGGGTYDDVNGAIRRLQEVREQRGLSELSPGDPDGLPEFIDVAIDG